MRTKQKNESEFFVIEIDVEMKKKGETFTKM